MNTPSGTNHGLETTTGNEDCDIGSKVKLDEESGGMRDSDRMEVDLGQSRIHLPPSQDAGDNTIPHSFGVEGRHQIYPTEPAPQTWGGTTNAYSERGQRGSFTGDSEQLVPAVAPLSHPQHASTSDPDYLHLANPNQTLMEADDNIEMDGIESDREYNSSQFSSLSVPTLESSRFLESSSGYHTSRTTEPLQEVRRNHHRSVRSAGDQASAGHGEVVSSSSGQEYPSDTQDDIPPHCRIDGMGPSLRASQKKKPKTNKSNRSGTSSRNMDQDFYKRGTGGGTGIERHPSSQATPGHLRSSHGDREVITTNTRHKQRKKSKEKTYPAEVDDAKMRKMEDNLALFMRVDPNLLQQHLRGCLKDEQCVQISDWSVGKVKPRRIINQELWKYIKRAPFWWQNLERALEECGYNELLAKLREA